MNELHDESNKLDAERKNLWKGVSRDHKDAAEVETAIAALQKKYETTSLSKDGEKKVLADIQFLKKSLPA